tara:strand:- start:586 stop:789 length:204 start_codon:yes stop_codon:yes gene_type:complete
MKTVNEHEMEQMLVGAQREEKTLRNYIEEICEIIEMQLPLRYQDAWLKSMVAKGYFKLTEEEEDGNE